MNLRLGKKGGSHPGTERTRQLVAPDNRNNNKKKEGKKQPGMACAQFTDHNSSIAPGQPMQMLDI